jgi:hypothetical protein
LGNILQIGDQPLDQSVCFKEKQGNHPFAFLKRLGKNDLVSVFCLDNLTVNPVLGRKSHHPDQFLAKPSHEDFDEQTVPIVRKGFPVRSGIS